MGHGARAFIALAVVVGTAAVLSLEQASADPLRSTSTSVSCPLLLDLEQTAPCTVNVADTDTSPATTPTGVVAFSSTNSHGVADRGTCTLSAGSCQFTHLGWDSTGSRTVAATYEGDSTHAGSSDAQEILVVVGPRPPCCFLPRVNGERLGEAKRAIRRFGFSVGRIDRAFSKRVHRGRVISERPGGGKLVAPHRKVDLVVSKGKRHARP